MGIKLKDIFGFVGSILVCLSAGFFGSIFTTPNIPNWYVYLAKPAFTPPNWVFAPAWTLLYVLMGIAAFLVWRKGLENKAVRVALMVFAIQLILNTLWSILFFGQHWLLIAFAEIVVLWFFILWSMILFHPISNAAAFLLAPYLIWVSFASLLNFSVWLLNR